MARRKTTSNSPSCVEAVRHKDNPKNMPTEELRDFVCADENPPGQGVPPARPGPRPQLVWKGKDEQDGAPREVPAVPVYIKEKIHPQAIIEDFKATVARAKGAGAVGVEDGLPEWTNRWITPMPPQAMPRVRSAR